MGQKPSVETQLFEIKLKSRELRHQERVVAKLQIDCENSLKRAISQNNLEQVKSLAEECLQREEEATALAALVRKLDTIASRLKKAESQRQTAKQSKDVLPMLELALARLKEEPPSGASHKTVKHTLKALSSNAAHSLVTADDLKTSADEQDSQAALFNKLRQCGATDQQARELLQMEEK